MSQPEVIDKKLKITDLITQGAFGRQITSLTFDDLKTVDDKVFVGLESHFGELSQFTYITGTSGPTVVFKLKAGSQYFRIGEKAQKIIVTRMEKFINNLLALRSEQLGIELKKSELIQPNQFQPDDSAVADEKLVYGNKAIKHISFTN